MKKYPFIKALLRWSVPLLLLAGARPGGGRPLFGSEALIIARVGREKITRSDLVGFRDEFDGMNDEEVLNLVIERRLLHQHARFAGIEINERQVDARLEQLAGTFPNLIDFYRHLEERSLTVTQLRRRIREQLLGEQLLHREVTRNVYVEPRELRDFIETNSRELVAMSTRVRLEAAFFQPGEAVPENPELLGGLMRDQGLMSVQDLAPALRAVVRDLPVGRFSEPVSHEGARVVLRVLERRAQEAADAPALVIFARRILHRQKYQEQYNRFIRDLRERTTIEYYDL